jgi:hypothetical protein
MRIMNKMVAGLLGGVGVLALIATGVVAQTPQPKSNPNTKVYGYKKTAPQVQAQPTAEPAPRGQPFEQLPSAVPFGSPQWWEMNLRALGNGGE